MVKHIKHNYNMNINASAFSSSTRNHLTTSSNRNSLRQPVRSSLSLEVSELKQRNSRRRSESLDPPEHRPPILNHRRNLSMEPQELARDLAAAVDGLNILPLAKKGAPPVKEHGANVDAAHDYAEIYTPSREKAPVWLKGGPPSGGSSTTTSDSVADVGTPRPPTPPLHRFPSWEAKIYQVANDGLAPGDENDSRDQDSTGVQTTRQQQTASGGYCDISVPVYATVKGVSKHFSFCQGSDPALFQYTYLNLTYPYDVVVVVLAACFSNSLDAIYWRFQ